MKELYFLIKVRFFEWWFGKKKEKCVIYMEKETIELPLKPSKEKDVFLNL